MQLLKSITKEFEAEDEVFEFEQEACVFVRESVEHTGRKGRLNPLNDYLFSQYMGTEECKECLISFLNAVLQEKITDIEIINNLDLPRESPEGKYARLDVRARLPEGTQINIEVQILNEDNIVQRSQYYNGRLYISGIGKGEDYRKLGRVISINILNFNYLRYPEYHISSHFRVDQHPEDLLTNDQELHFLELKKFYRSREYDRNNPLHRWLKYFDRNLSEEELEVLIGMDGAIKMAEERTRKVASSEEEMRYYEALEDARRNMVSSQRYQHEKGYRAGEAKGRKKGEAEGRKEGEAKAKSEIVQASFRAGLLKETIAEITGLTLQEVEEYIRS